MTLEVRVSNQRAQRLYRRFGYAPAGVRRNYYVDGSGDKEHALVMWCHDVDGGDHQERLASVEDAFAEVTDWGPM